MTTFKLALIGTAALAATSISAQANDLADLKAQIEALNTRIATLEAAPAVPAGFSLMTFGKAPAIVVPGFEVDPMALPMVNTISVMPTADVPASASIQWSGLARAAIVYKDASTDYWNDGNGNGTVQGAGTPASEVEGIAADSLEIHARGHIDLAATTDTAVGLVGVKIGLEANWNGVGGGAVNMTEAWGYWAISPEMTLGGGYAGSVAGVGHGGDILTAMYSGGVQTVGGGADPTQFRLSYASGPLSAAIALEDSDYGHADQNDVGFAGEVKYAGDLFSAEVAGFAHGGDWQVGAGVTANLSDMFKVSVAAGVGEDENASASFRGPGPGMLPVLVFDNTNAVLDGVDVSNSYDRDYWVVTGAVVANVSDAVRVEAGASYSEGDGARLGLLGGNAYNITDETLSFAAGVYYTPVAQLTLGLEGGWTASDYTMTTPVAAAPDWYKSTESMTVDFVSVFRF